MAKSINKTVEEKAIADIDLLIKKLVEADEALIQASKSGKTFSNSITAPPATSGQLNKELAEAQKIISQLQKEQKAYEGTLASLKSKVDALSAAKKGATAQDRQTIIDNREIRKELDGQAIANSNLTTFMQKLSVERQLLLNTMQPSKPENNLLEMRESMLGNMNVLIGG
jgi:predicted  nucleic acid-binding Zn-ribbon protein